MDDIINIEKNMFPELKQELLQFLEDIISFIDNSPDLPCFLKDT